MHHGERRAPDGLWSVFAVYAAIVGELAACWTRGVAGIHSIGMPSTMPRVSALILGLSLTGGCSKSSPDTAAPESGDDEDVSAGQAAERAPLRVTGVYLDPALMAVCELDDREALVQFDRDAQGSEVSAVLAAVASCVKDGPLQGRRIELVGHASRSDEYFRSFGSSRADAIRGALVQDGLKADDIVTHAATPEDDADAADEWPSERRVDLRVATRHAH